MFDSYPECVNRGSCLGRSATTADLLVLNPST